MMYKNVLIMSQKYKQTVNKYAGCVQQRELGGHRLPYLLSFGGGLLGFCAITTSYIASRTFFSWVSYTTILLTVAFWVWSCLCVCSASTARFVLQVTAISLKECYSWHFMQSKSVRGSPPRCVKHCSFTGKWWR